MYARYAEFVACHFPTLFFVYWLAGLRTSREAEADLVVFFAVAIAYALHRIWRLRLPTAHFAAWTAGLLLAAPFALPLLYWTLLVKADR